MITGVHDDVNDLFGFVLAGKLDYFLGHRYCRRSLPLYNLLWHCWYVSKDDTSSNDFEHLISIHVLGFIYKKKTSDKDGDINDDLDYYK